MKVLRKTGYVTGAVLLLFAGFIMYQSRQTEQDISAFRNRVVEIAARARAPVFDRAAIAGLPTPVQRYFNYTFKEPVNAYTVVRLEEAGDFRLPLSGDFNPTTAEQVIAIGTPALVFSATTPVFTGVWARAYDYFAGGEMEMKARILSAITVVDESETEELNRISIRRWLLESPLYPMALLPGGPITWEAVDDQSARATVRADGLQASMLFHFNDEGQITYLSAEKDGDLTTPYHGSGEHVTRDDYRLVGNMMIPHRFTISRAAGGEVFPFFDGGLTRIEFE
jgi:hypothetical protein